MRISKFMEGKIISYKSKDQWDIFIIVLAIFNSFTIPFELAFEFDFMKALSYKIISVLIDILFTVDIVLMFLTSFRNRRGHEEKDPGKIAINYVTSPRFLFDMLSILGSSLFTAIFSKLTIFGIAKLARIRRLGVYLNE